MERTVQKKDIEELVSLQKLYDRTGDRNIIDDIIKTSQRLSKQSYGDLDWLAFDDITSAAQMLNKSHTVDDVLSILKILDVGVTN